MAVRRHKSEATGKVIWSYCFDAPCSSRQDRKQIALYGFAGKKAAVVWPQRSEGTVTLLGRPRLPYERTSSMVLDPDTLETYQQPPAVAVSQEPTATTKTRARRRSPRR
jgi:hypothetical protein